MGSNAVARSGDATVRHGSSYQGLHDNIVFVAFRVT